MSTKIELVDVEVRSYEKLIADGDLLTYEGQPVARLAINWGWTRWYDNERGDGFGIVRNTGYYHCTEEEFREYAASQGEPN